MPVLQDRVQETTTTGGTGTLTLAGAVTGYRSFNVAFTLGDITYYTIDNGNGEWEIGVGTVGSGTLSRNSVLESSNANALVNFSAGTKRVFCSAPTKVLLPDQTSNSGKVLTTNGVDPAWTTTLNGITLGNITPGTGAFTTLSASSTVSGTGFSTYLASPPAIGGTTPAAGNFTTLGATGNVTLGDAAGDTLTINGTAVSIPNNLNFDSNTLFIDAGNNRVGVGTNSPGTALQVNGGISPVTTDANVLGLTSNRYLAVYSRIWSTDNGISGWNIDGNTSPGYDLAWSFNGGEKVRFSSSGNVGIGTSSPAYKLDITCGDSDGLRINSSLNGVINFAQTGTTTGQIVGTSTGAGELIFKALRSMQFYTGGITTPVGYSCFGPNGGLTVGNSSLNIYGIPANGLLVQNNVSVGATGVPYSLGKQLTVQVGNTASASSSSGITCGAYSSLSDSIVSIIESFGARYDSNGSFGGRHGAAYRRADGTAIASNASLGIYAFGGQWGTDTSFQAAKVLYPASIVGVAEGSFTSATAMPTGLSFRTGSTGDSISTVNVTYGTERLRLDSSGQCIWKPNGVTSAMTLDASGNLNIGITGRPERLAIFGNSGPQALCVLSGNTAGDVGNSALVISKFDNNTTTSQVYVRFFVNAFGTACGQINANGASTAAFGTYSDARIKDNITALSNQLTNICALKPSEFDYKDGSGHQIGFIAQEMQEIYPDVVGEGKDGMLMITGWSKTEARLVKAIQELHAEIELLKAKVN